ncbi:hypothetical protein Celgi_1279 [Cellulomonas gilvus ATCC 13127]|uniref:Uncharacterized protein n=1 Tax=Cellulomonas gilvus (strain ATCC 13127 / NRRL B-14078) TaxID=593907 RepID=F8A2E1_CELGA|nr:hypothetical protein Celgi_1279 [Cellulomonas gilvus ATCC 13127]
MLRKASDLAGRAVQTGVGAHGRDRYRGPVAAFSPARALTGNDRRRLDLRRGDRVLVATTLADGRRAVATRLALHVLSDASTARTPWADVDRGSLDATTRTLTVRWVWGASDAFVFTSDRGSVAFTQTFRERVQSSVVHAASVPLPAGGQARVALRRDEDGELFTQVVADDGVDLADPAVTAAVDRAESAVRSAAGLPG